MQSPSRRGYAEGLMMVRLALIAVLAVGCGSGVHLGAPASPEATDGLSLAIATSGCTRVTVPIAGGPPTPTPAPGVASAFEVRSFVSESVSQDGQPMSLVNGSSLTLTFYEQLCVITASADCRSLGAWTIRGARLVLAPEQFEGQPLIEPPPCPEPVRLQDDQLKAFLASGPTVSLRDHKLALVSGTSVIWLAELAGF